MLRSILVSIDGSDSSIVAGHLAIELALRQGAHLVGLGIPDTETAGNAKTMADIGWNAERVRTALHRFSEEAKSRNLSDVEFRYAETLSSEAVERAATASDLVLIGRESMADAGGELYALPLCIERIVRNEPRPLLLVPGAIGINVKAVLERPVLVAFDGSPTASRALHMFALLGVVQKQPIHVLTVDQESWASASALAARACQLLEHHGTLSTHAVARGPGEVDTPAEAILDLARSLDVGMVVMGAYGHSGIREIFGSCTRRVLNACPATLFLYH